MNIDDLRELARLADGIVGQSPDRVAEVHRRIDGAAGHRPGLSALRWVLFVPAPLASHA